MVKETKISCAIWRGGTSKGVFFKRENLPGDEKIRDQILLSIMGSPDPIQIDGLGGARSSTSKVMMVSPSQRPGMDIDYTFGAVGIDKPIIDYRGNCGNLTSAVGPFAIDEGLVHPVEPITEIRMYNTNTNKVILADIPVRGGKVQVHGDYIIDGVPGTAARINLHFLDPEGAGTGSVFPTGNPIDKIDIGGEQIECSIVDVSNPVVFVRASDFGLSGAELPDETNADVALLSKFERIRSAAAEMIGFVKDRKEATRLSPQLPLIAFVAAPRRYTTVSNHAVDGGEINLLARVLSMQKVHHAYALTAAICTAAAAKLQGTIVHEVFKDRGENSVVIGHPKGVIVPLVKVDQGKVKEVVIARTARLLLKGETYVQY